LTPDVFDEAALRAFGEAQGQLMTEMLVATSRLHYRIHSALTEEQQQQLQEKRESRREKRERMREQKEKRFGGGWQ
jgi:Spy/CpxP family protein refolding chaperone